MLKIKGLKANINEKEILKGLNIKINTPLMILEKAFCEAKPTITARIPAPANNAVPMDFK